MGDFLSSNLPALILVLAGLCLVAMVVMQSLQISSMRRRIDQLTGGAGEGNLEDVLIAHLESVHAMGQDLDELIARTAFLESSARHHYAHQGLVRFNPFPDTGGNQSFALALLDESENGFIVSSLHSRTGTRIYAKAIVGGKTDTTLSTEEAQAIEEARSRRPSRSPQAPARSRTASRPQESAPKSSPAASKEAPAVGGQTPAPVPVKAPPAPRVAPVRDGANRPAPAPAPVPAPAPAATAAAGAVVPTSAAAEPDEDGLVSESTNRSVSGKGQSKTEAVAPPSTDAADSEKTGARPGRNPGAQASPPSRPE